jgi:hypothetical protein
MSCSDAMTLKGCPPIYVMANDEVERTRWIQGIETLRKVAITGSQSSLADRSSSSTQKQM